MAFWGVEVKPGKSFTHTADDARGRLHISQATLGSGTATKKSVVQCNVGSKSPVFLCSLCPERSESCQLNLEFEEVDEVVFSVIGPRSVHLTGYFLGSSRYHNLHDESESYGKDIADTDTERSSRHSEEDEYEDSFIDDTDLKLFPPSPLSDDGVTEETLDRKKAKNGKGSRRRLKKKYKFSESDNDSGAQQQMLVNGTAAVAALDSETEDMLPISSLCKGDLTTKSRKLEAEEEAVNENDETNLATKSGKFEVEEKDDEKNGENSHVEVKDEAVVNGEAERGDNLQHLSMPSSKVEVGNWVSPKKNSKDQAKGKNNLEADSVHPSMVIRNDETPQDELKAQDMPEGIEQNQRQANDKSVIRTCLSNSAGLPPDSLPPVSQVGPGSDVKPKKRKKRERAEEKSFEAKISDSDNVNREGKTQQDEVKSDSMGNLPMKIEQFELQPNANRPEENKKKKKKRKIQEEGKDMNAETPMLSTDEKNRNSDSKPSQLGTLSDGVVIEELETGKPDGKVAASGKKIGIRYIGKLKENGQVFDSNLDSTIFKFRLGEKDIIDGLNIGLEGMRVGGKRRLIVPPSMGYGSVGDGQSVPPNSWLVYDVELVKVR